MTSASPRARRSRSAARVALEAAGLRLDDTLVALRAGSIHYFEHEPATWPALLAGARALGMTAIETVVPWALHETAVRCHDFGATDARRDLPRFLTLARDAGLHVLLRLGPLVDAELDRSGLPARVVGDVRCMARSARGNPLVSFAPPRMFAVPSLASRAFREEASHWLATAAAAVASHAWPQGPVVLVEVEARVPLAAMDAPWNADHHPDALAAYRRLLKRRHRTLSALRRAHGDARATWRSASPSPHLVAEDAVARARRTDALEARDDAAREALRTWKRVLERGPLGHLAIVSGSPELDAAETPARVDVGAPPWQRPRSDAEHLRAVLARCAQGERRLRLHMLADAGRWIGAPLDARGRARAGAEPLQRLLAVLDETSWHLLARRSSPPPGFEVAPAPLELVVDESPDAPVVVWLVNPGDEPRHAELRLPRALALHDPLDGTDFAVSATQLVLLPPRGTRMLTLGEALC